MSARAELTFEDVHRIRTEGRPDTYWQQVLGCGRTTIRKARIGQTFKKHPTPPDTAVRVSTPREPGQVPLSGVLAKWPRVEGL
jgi:hypothetical protein